MIRIRVTNFLIYRMGPGESIISLSLLPDPDPGDKLGVGTRIGDTGHRRVWFSFMV